MAIVILGKIFDMSNPESPVEISGYHVDSIYPIDGADGFLVDPKIPHHQFSGVVKSYRYRFDSKEHAELFLSMENVNDGAI